MAEAKSQIEDGAVNQADISRGQDVLVTAIVALIGAAVALGLYVQAGFGPIPAVSVGAGLFIWLLSAHFLITRMRLRRLIDGRLDQLSQDVSHLKKETEITDLLAEGHNELHSGQEAIEKALHVIVTRMDQYDHRLKVLYKLGKKNNQKLNNEISGQGQEKRFLELQTDLQNELQSQLQQLAQHIQTFENRFDDDKHQQYGLIKAELDVLELIVHQLNGTDHQARSQFSEKALEVIHGLRRLPVMKTLDDETRVEASAALVEGGDEARRAGMIEQTIGQEDLSNEPGTLQDAGSHTVVPEVEGRSEVATRIFSTVPPGGGAPEMPSQENLLAAVGEAIEANRIELFMQPIVNLPERDLIFYEVFSRLRNDVGQLILPRDFIGVADMAGLTPIVDNQIILRSIQVVQRLVNRGNGKVLFCNLSMTSLRDADFFAEFMDFMEANQWLSEYLVFEFTQKSVDGAGVFEYERLAAISKLGFRFSMDQITRLDLDFKALSELNFNYVKISAGLLLGNAPGAKAEIHPADLDAYLDRLNIAMIVVDVEREALVRQLRDHNVRRVQGSLFCEPKPVRPEIFEQRDVSAA